MLRSNTEEVLQKKGLQRCHPQQHNCTTGCCCAVVRRSETQSPRPASHASRRMPFSASSNALVFVVAVFQIVIQQKMLDARLLSYIRTKSSMSSKIIRKRFVLIIIAIFATALIFTFQVYMSPENSSHPSNILDDLPVSDGLVDALEAEQRHDAAAGATIPQSQLDCSKQPPLTSGDTEDGQIAKGNSLVSSGLYGKKYVAAPVRGTQKAESGRSGAVGDMSTQRGVATTLQGARVPSSPAFKLHIISFSSSESKGFCEMLLSAAAHDVTITVLGWKGIWRGFGTKIAAMMAYLDQANPDDVVLLHDGYDIHYQANAAEIASKFASIGAKILYGAEKNCWPMNDDRCKLFPPSPLPRWAYGPDTVHQEHSHDLNIPRFLNAGGLIGYVSALRPLFKDMMDEVSELERQDRGADDQELANMRLVSGKWGIQLDYYMELFMSMHYSKRDLELVPQPGSKEADGHMIRKHKVTGTIPGLLHYNGNGKEWMQEFADEMWWSRKDALDRDAVYFIANGTKVPWNDHCTKYFNVTVAAEPTE